MTKQLTQAVFENTSTLIKSAAVDKDGVAYLYPCKASQVYEETGIGFYGYIACSRLIIGTGYDTTNWQHSAIDKE